MQALVVAFGAIEQIILILAHVRQLVGESCINVHLTVAHERQHPHVARMSSRRSTDHLHHREWPSRPSTARFVPSRRARVRIDIHSASFEPRLALLKDCPSALCVVIGEQCELVIGKRRFERARSHLLEQQVDGHLGIGNRQRRAGC